MHKGYFLSPIFVTNVISTVEKHIAFNEDFSSGQIDYENKWNKWVSKHGMKPPDQVNTQYSTDC